MWTVGVCNGVDLTGLLGDIKEDWGSGGVPQKLKLFCETTHNICINIQQTTVAVTLADILNNMTSKILGGHYHGCPPFINIGGTCPPCPVGIDAHGCVINQLTVNCDHSRAVM